MAKITEPGALTEAVYYILLSLYKPMHGYGIMQNIKDLSNGRLSLGPGTLYGALNNLLEKGWIIPEEPIEQESRKKEYRITDLGKQVLALELSRLQELLNNGKKIVGGKE